MEPEMVGLISVDSWGAALPKLLLSKAILVSTLTSEWTTQRTKYPLSTSSLIGEESLSVPVNY
jgi:hypothetical protein